VAFFISAFPTSTLNAPCATFPAHLIFHDFITLMTFGEEDKSQSFSLSNFLQNLINLSPLDPALYSQMLIAHVFLFNVRYQVSHLREKPSKIIVLYYFFIFS
jgi:hypothetical protein